MEKYCNKCRVTKAAKSFPKSRNRRDGLGSWCKSCANTANKAYYQKNKEHINLKGREWRQSNRSYIKTKRKENRKRDIRKILLASAKHRAKTKGIMFDLQIEDIVIPECYPILGIKLELYNETQERTSPSIDRIDSTKGYTKENIMIISWRANTMKTDANLEELTMFAEWIIANQAMLKSKMN